jgi:hypothetical protein
VTAAHDGAPAFLDALGDLVAEGLAAHPRLRVLTVHGWNVVQPAVDIGFGAHPAPDTLAGGGVCAIAPDFATTMLPRFAAALDARGIIATPGLRYPARARENLLQLFTRRYATDERAPSAASPASPTASTRSSSSVAAASPARPPGATRSSTRARRRSRTTRRCTRARGHRGCRRRTAGACRAEFVAPGLAGLAAIDPHGGRLLLFPDDGASSISPASASAVTRPTVWVRSA